MTIIIAPNKGFNICLISRTESKLSEVASELQAKYSTIKTKVLPQDFNKFDEAARAEMKKNLLALGGDGMVILINNVGVSYDYPMFFHELSNERVKELLELNISSTVYMTR